MTTETLPAIRESALATRNRSPRGHCPKKTDQAVEAVANHTLRRSCARHLLTSGSPINYLSRRLGHRSIQTTLIYLELLPDPTGSLAAVP